MDLPIINTRADLDAIGGTEQHIQFMNIISGSVNKVRKNLDDKVWERYQDLSMVNKFEFDLDELGELPVPVLPEWVDEPENKSELKLQGILFDNVYCSATAEDQNGLTTIMAMHDRVGSSFSTQFYFANGSKLTLDDNNIDEFLTVWWAFRSTFFNQES